MWLFWTPKYWRLFCLLGYQEPKNTLASEVDTRPKLTNLLTGHFGLLNHHIWAPSLCDRLIQHQEAVREYASILLPNKDGTLPTLCQNLGYAPVAYIVKIIMNIEKV